MPISELLDLSMNSTLSRTVITSTTVILSLLGMFFFGPEAIQSYERAYRASPAASHLRSRSDLRNEPNKTLTGVAVSSG